MALAVAGCHPYMTLQEAQAQCTKQGGLLVIIYSQKFTRTRMGPVVASPGDCISPDRFLKPDPALGSTLANQPPTAAQPPVSPAPPANPAPAAAAPSPAAAP